MLDIVVLVVAMTFPSIMAWLSFIVLPEADISQTQMTVVLALGKIVQFALPVVYVSFTQPNLLGWPRRTSRGVGIGLASGVVVGMATFALYYGWLSRRTLLLKTGPLIRQWLVAFHADNPAGFLVVALVMSIPHSLLEEYYWRWFVYGWMARKLPKVAAMALSSLGFMAHHVFVIAHYLPGHFWSAAVPFSLCVACGGFFWAWLYERSGSLWGPWLSHLLIDLAIMGVGYEMLNRQ